MRSHSSRARRGKNLFSCVGVHEPDFRVFNASWSVKTAAKDTQRHDSSFLTSASTKWKMKIKYKRARQGVINRDVERRMTIKVSWHRRPSFATKRSNSCRPSRCRLPFPFIVTLTILIKLDRSRQRNQRHTAWSYQMQVVGHILSLKSSINVVARSFARIFFCHRRDASRCIYSTAGQLSFIKLWIDALRG